MFQVRKKDVLNFSIPRACTYFFFSDTCMPLEKRYYLKCQAEMRRWKVIFSVSGFLLNSKCNLEKKKKEIRKKSHHESVFKLCATPFQWNSGSRFNIVHLAHIQHQDRLPTFSRLLFTPKLFSYGSLRRGK